MDEPQVGRELDTAVAEKVMRWYGDRTGYGWSWFDAEHKAVMPDWVTTREELSTILPHYSTNIADAWQVVEHLRAQRIYLIRLTNGVTNYACWLGRGVSVDGVQAVGDTAPEAICRAALLVVDNEGKEG